MVPLTPPPSQQIEPLLLEIEKKVTLSRDTSVHIQTPRKLFHYTTAMGLKGILDTKKIWATHFRFLNDASEVDYGMFVIGSCIDALRAQYQDKITQVFLDRVLKSVNPFNGMFDCYISCFCEKDDLLNQWRDYAGNGGYAIGLTGELIGLRREHREVRYRSEIDYEIFRVIYNAELQGRLIREPLELVLVALQKISEGDLLKAEELIPRCCQFLRAQLAGYLISFKHPVFEMEQEWRLCHMVRPHEDSHVQFRDGQFGLTPYVLLDPCPQYGPDQGNFPLSSITHAPTKDADNVRFALDVLLRTKGYRNYNVSGSILPIRVR